MRRFADIFLGVKNILKQSTQVLFLAGVSFLSLQSMASVKVGGFVDAQYRWFEKNHDGYGIYVPDGALQLNHAAESSSVVVDLPFAYSGTDNNFSFAQSKAQAYWDWRALESMGVRLGQFDGVLGFEANDSSQILFNSQGYLYSVNPTTHTGIALTTEFGVHALTFILAAPDSQGALEGGNPEFALDFSGAPTANLDFAVGFVYRGKTTASEWLADFVLATNLSEALAMDFELLLKGVEDQDLGWGALGQFTYSSSEKSDWALRTEYASSLIDSSNTSLSVGYSHQATQALQLKVDTAWTRAEPSAGAATTDARVSLGGVYTF